MLQHLDQIHPQAKEWIEPLLQKICNEFKNNVDSIYLYGEVTTKDFLPNHSQIQSLVLFDDFHFPRAKQLQPIVKTHLKHGVIAPLCLSVEMFERSTDTFPLEFAEIKEKHIHVFGECNRVKTLVIPAENLRLKLEEQIKGKLIRLREVYMEIGDQPKPLLEILVLAMNDLVPVLRNILRFMDESEPPKATTEVIKKLDDCTEFSVAVLHTIWNHVQKKYTIPKENTLNTYSDLADVLLELSKFIDGLEKTS